MANYVKSINGYSIFSANAVLYGTCSTQASTAAKVVTCGNLQELNVGTVLVVRFTNGNSNAGALTINANSTGSKDVYVNGAPTSSTNSLLWATGVEIAFVYDGTNWNVAGEPRCFYGTCTTSAGTSSKTATIPAMVICAGTRLALAMSNGNTSSSATLNVSSTGSKNIYYDTGTTAPTTSNGYGWAAGDMVDLVFDGSAWRYADSVALTKLNAQ